MQGGRQEVCRSRRDLDRDGTARPGGDWQKVSGEGAAWSLL